VALPGMGTASPLAAVVRQYGHFRRPDGFPFSQRSPDGAWMLAAPTIYAVLSTVTAQHHFRPPIPQSSSAKKVVGHCLFCFESHEQFFSYLAMLDIVNFLKSLEF
jgi:hypothetical protein